MWEQWRFRLWQFRTAWHRSGMLYDERLWWALIVGLVWAGSALTYLLAALGEQGRVYLSKWLEVSFWAFV